ncbi:hypothetical protein IV417_02755 [Alphaproteobacteria bacterium KMM 3653]|uniref:Uncharacterized protein n=1 Tax=Harenicola maris TaxID=2841044 RepID=A0AAP2CMI2_9RHOB|nr:hypothetical protein [Harenicola maris]
MVRELKNMPAEGHFERGRVDVTTGAVWIYVSRAMAHGHPMGRLNWVLYLIIGYFAAGAAVKLSVWGQGGPALMFWGAILGIMTAIGLALRVPWALILAVAQAGLSVAFLAFSLTAGGSLATLAEAVVGILIVMYLIDGQRPNLAYRYRYRSYQGEAEE